MALELHTGRSWRDHADTDVGIIRSDVVEIRSVLDGWDIHVAAAGRLAPWDGGDLHAADHENNLWCRRSPTGPWRLDVTVGDGDESTWIYRRDPTIRLPWSEAVLRTAAGIPYLAPQVQLLFKSRHLRPKDDRDAGEVIPALDDGAREWLAGRLPAEHPWRAQVGAGWDASR